MQPQSNLQLPSWFAELSADLVPAVTALGEGRYAVGVAGSIGKGAADEKSDTDIRLYCDRRADDRSSERARAEVDRVTNDWAGRGVTIDDCWIRTIGEVDSELDLWLHGTARPKAMVWTVWGYYLPTDIVNQLILEDPDGVLAGWQHALASYPPVLKNAIVERHSQSLRYWISDYHYRSKVARADTIFLAGLTTRLVHDMVQLLFAVNEVYFPGDGNNLRLLAGMRFLPPEFARRIDEILYPTEGARRFALQRERAVELANEVLELVASHVDST